MNIEKFFEKIINKKIDMQNVFRRYVIAKDDFYTITGVSFSDLPKVKGQGLGFDDLLANIETLLEEYTKLSKEYTELYDFCKKYINKLNDKRYRLIIEYSYIDEEDDKRLSESLKDYHNIDYSDGYIRKLKKDAVEEFESIINKYKEEIDNFYIKLIQNNTK